MLPFTAAPTNGQRLYYLAQAVGHAVGLSGVNPPAVLPTNVGDLPLRFTSVASAGFPQLAAWASHGYGVLAVGGVQSVAEAVRVVDGWVDYGVSQRHPGIVNFEMMQRYNAVEQGLRTALEPHCTHLVCVGHSAGSYAATVFANYWTELRVGNSADVTTFGAPRLGNAAFATWREALKPIDMVMEGDIVPTLPGTMLEYPMPHALLTWRQSQSLSSFVRPYRYLFISSGGVFEWMQVVPNVVLPATIQTYGQLADFVRGASGPHNIASYLSRLMQFVPVQRAEETAPTLRRHNAVVPPEPVGGEEQRVVREQLRRERESSVAPQAAIRGRASIRVVRDGRKWVVLVQGRTVFMHDRKRTCRRVARTIRRMDDTMNVTGVWAADDIWPDSWHRPIAV